LFFARLSRLADPGVTVDVYERNEPDDAFGFGVVFSERTIRQVRAADPETHDRIVAAGVPIAEMELRLPAGTLRYGGFAFASISRHALLLILQDQAARAGVSLHFGTEIPVGDLPDGQVVVIADGANSAHRQSRERQFGTSVEEGSAPYMWLGTAAHFDAATFSFVRTDVGSFAMHAYPYADGMSTVVVETDPNTVRAAGLVQDSAFSGCSDEHSLRFLSEIFADHLDGHKLVGNRSRWTTFRVVRNRTWSEHNAVLIGDAAHTAHFTVGSGTKMAMEDAIALADAVRRGDDRSAAFAEYERVRRPLVERTQRRAAPSMRWWETFARRLHLPLEQFGMHFMTRAAALTYAGMRRRFPDQVDRAEQSFLAGAEGHAATCPLRLGDLVLPNRIVAIQQSLGAEPSQEAGLVLGRGATPVAREGQVIGTLVTEDTDFAGTPLVFVELDCPAAADTTAADDLVRRAAALVERGATGVVLGSTTGDWPELLELASRVRTEAGVPVAVMAPAGWAVDLSRESTEDTWQARTHLALICGRADLIASDRQQGKDGLGHGRHN
jgi:anthraniloyl-CoA monooxygenase